MPVFNRLSKTVAGMHRSMLLQKFLSIKANSVFYGMTIAFSFFFLGPLLGVTYLGMSKRLLGREEVLFCFLGIFVFSLLGYIILRQISDSILSVESRMARWTGDKDLAEHMGENEVGNIALIAESMDLHLRVASQALARRMQEINALRELGSLPIAHFSTSRLLDVVMAKAIALCGACGGAVVVVARNASQTGLTCRCVAGTGLVLAAGQAVPGSTGFLAAVLREDKTRILERGQADPQGRMFDRDVGSALVVPFDEMTGCRAMALLVKSDGLDWDTDRIEFLATFFGAAGSMLRMKELGIRERETSDELKSVLSIIRTINSGLEEKDLLAAVSGQLFNVIPSRWVGLALLSENGSQLRLTHTFEKTAGNGQVGIVLNKETSAFQAAIDTVELIAIDDLEREDAFFELPIFMELGLKSCLIKRLDASGRAIGALCLGSDIQQTFGRRDKRVFKMVAMGIALALEQTRLLAKERSKSAELEVLNRIGVALTSPTFEMKRMLRYILDMVASLVKVEAGSIMLVENEQLIFQAALGVAEKNLEGLRIKIGQEGVSGWVAATGEPIIVQDVEQNPHFCEDIDKRTGFRTRNLLCVPMITAGRIIGVIELLNKENGSFTEENLRAARSVASSAAIALENSRLYNESRNLTRREKEIRTIFQKYVPEEIVSDILRRGESERMTVGEKKIVTVCNVDIRGYSAMSRQAATEDVVGVLNYFFMKMGTIILKYKGVLDKYLGDGLLAIFGAPVVTRNPALDATLAAIEMTEAIEEVSKLSLERCGLPLKIGVSINTGEAIVGNIGFERKMEYTVIGDVVNQTFRLQDLTRRKSNCILVGETTFREVRQFVHAHQWQVKRADGSESVTDIYEVTGKKAGFGADYRPQRLWDLPAGAVH